MKAVSDADEQEGPREKARLYRLHLALLGGALVAFLVGAAFPDALRLTLVLAGAMVVGSAFAGLWAGQMLGGGYGFLLHQQHADSSEARRAEVARRYRRFKFFLYVAVGVGLVLTSLVGR